MAYEVVIAALADPTRRGIVEALREAPQPVGRLAERFPVSRPAISQHLKVLGDAGLVTAEVQGTRRVYSLAPDGIESLRGYLDQLWDDVLAAYARQARKQSQEEFND